MLLLPAKQQLFNRTGGGVVHMATVAIVPLIELVLPTVISTFSRYGPGVEISNFATLVLNNADWGEANRAHLFELTLPATFTVRSFRWTSGTAVFGNYDFGLYDSKFSLLRSIGSTAHPGSNITVTLQITPLSLQPGNYWIAMVADLSTFGILSRAPFEGSELLTIPIKSANNSFPLPQTLTLTTPIDGRMQPLAITNEVP